MKNNYKQSKVTEQDALKIAQELYNLSGEIQSLPGEIDFNFKIKSKEASYILKISRPECEMQLIDFQQKIHQWILGGNQGINIQEPLKSVQGDYITTSNKLEGGERKVRLYSWIDGRLWSAVNPHTNNLLLSLGREAGSITKSLQGFSHEYANRKFEWDIAQAKWVKDYIELFDADESETIKFYLEKFADLQPQYKKLRKSVVHNDVNDNNIIVGYDAKSPQVKSIIDFGDAVYTQTINDLAIAIAYAAMHKPDPLGAACEVVKGYHSNFPLLEEEIDLLFYLIAIRLVISVTKSAINKKKEPDNTYLQISEKPAWELLHKWGKIDATYASCFFREACGFAPYPFTEKFEQWAESQKTKVSDLFPELGIKNVTAVDMSVSSTWLGNMDEMSNIELTAYKIKQLGKSFPKSLIAGGYMETRPFYSSLAFRKEGNNSIEYRSTHLGLDFWVDSGMRIHSILDGEIFSTHDNSGDKNYGPTIIIKHEVTKELTFFSLYGHLSEESLQMHEVGDKIKKGDIIGFIGNRYENGSWPPHLHFQIILNMLGNKLDFPGVAYYKEIEVWKSICPNPNLIFKEDGLKTKVLPHEESILQFRRNHLGKSLSISYDEPLHMVRGDGTYLMDANGQRYLDTVNNVAHVGHEHPRVVKAGQDQMAVLNTNTRYLHENINIFAKELLDTFPKELSVVHFVNSGSEANELALRMAKTFTKAEDIVAMEIGYHGNTSGCISVSSYKFNGKGGDGAPENTHIVPLPDAYRGLYQGSNTGPKYAAHVNEAINRIHEKGRKVAAFICESIISCGGQIELPDNFLSLAYESIRKAGGVCIADEVQVGCGRVGNKFWGFQLHGVVPDIVTIGKPIGNGHPLAAVVCTQKVAETFANGMEYFNTFGGNPVSCAIGREVLQVIKDEKLQENAREVGKHLKSELKKLQKEFPVIGEVRGQGLFLGFELADENKMPLTEKASYLANRMKELNILMSTDGKDVNVLKIKPPIIFSRENVDELIYCLRKVFKEDFMYS